MGTVIEMQKIEWNKMLLNRQGAIAALVAAFAGRSGTAAECPHFKRKWKS
jgi:hypothetical protein